MTPLKTITLEELNAGLIFAGVTQEQLKLEFAVLFPDAARVLNINGHPLAKDASMVWLGFKAGIMVGKDLQ